MPKKLGFKDQCKSKIPKPREWIDRRGGRLAGPQMTDWLGRLHATR